tara:strand:+ start:3290 stop:4999 length:1710 start_codon:yes stop_codon:yes gene_type:complete
MKTIKYIIITLILVSGTSCNENDFLDETPLEFYSINDSYNTIAQFDKALVDLYGRVRYIRYSGNMGSFALLSATDIAYAGRKAQNQFGNYDVELNPTSSTVAFQWDNWYKVIANANTILSRLPNAEEVSVEDKTRIEAEARFFRGLSYRYLVYLYGGVPIVLDEIATPTNDFVRASKEEILLQIRDDLEYAAMNLNSIGEVEDGHVSSIVAGHYLGETYISLGLFDDAIAALTNVINDPSVSLMTGRFGVKANEDPHDRFLTLGPGDVYWDLFRPGNQNRSGGNLEALWVAQMETDVIGGFVVTTSRSNNPLEFWAGHAGWDNAIDPDGKQGMTGKIMSTYNEGSGFGVGLMANTDYYLQEVWQSDWDNDIRNAPHNIVRDIYYNNPSSAYYGKSAAKGPFRSSTYDATNWRYYDWPSKISTPGDHPDALFENKETLVLSSAVTGSTFRDMYYLRLAETYLLRAEAYFHNGNLTNAAGDINAVRERSNAKAITGADVSIDYILDERARELVYEEPRRIILHRLGLLVERVRKYNFLNSDEIKDYHGLWPIPNSAIEANIGATLEQNPGY